MIDPIPANKGEQREAMFGVLDEPPPTPQHGITPEQANYNADVLIRMNRLDARLASLENVYADVRRAQNHLEGLESPAPATAAGDDGWVNPYKQIPDEGQDVLIWRKHWDVQMKADDYLIVIARWETRGEQWPRFHSGHEGKILAWHPLPEPPAKS